MSRSTGARSITLALALLAAGAIAPPGVARAETPIPDPPARWLTDRAGFLSPGAAAQLDATLADHDRRTGRQIVVYIDRTTGGVPIEDWAVRAFERWRVGRKGLDDGMALFVFSDDRKLRIEVGYGLEGLLPDVVAARIISDRIVPRIQAGDRDGAIRAGVETMIAASGGEGARALPGGEPQLRAWHLVVGGIVVLFLIGLFITHPGLAWLLLMEIASGRGGGGWGGGRGGWGGGGGFSGGGGRSGGGGASGSW
jgi:uncharacterized protein